MATHQGFLTLLMQIFINYYELKRDGKYAESPPAILLEEILLQFVDSLSHLFTTGFISTFVGSSER